MLFRYLRDILYRRLSHMDWQTTLGIVAFYFLAAWLMLFIAGEDALIGADYIYWVVVTASTVGYGDLSPTTPLGKWVVSLFVIPVGLSLFATLVGKVAAFSAYRWRKGVMGLKQLRLKDHILVIGWDDNRTMEMLELLIIESKQNLNRSICLCVKEHMENPLPDDIGFVRVQSYNSEQEMKRCCVETASTIIVDGAQDDITLTAALYANSKNAGAHMVAYFKDTSLANLLRSHCPNVEVTPSVSVEMMVKASMDPGSSMLHEELLSADEGMTQFSVPYPQGLKDTEVRTLYISMREQYAATLIAIDNKDEKGLQINPSLDTVIDDGSTLYYIAKHRIPEIDWPLLTAAH